MKKYYEGCEECKASKEQGNKYCPKCGKKL